MKSSITREQRDVMKNDIMKRLDGVTDELIQEDIDEAERRLAEIGKDIHKWIDSAPHNQQRDNKA